MFLWSHFIHETKVPCETAVTKNSAGLVLLDSYFCFCLQSFVYPHLKGKKRSNGCTSSLQRCVMLLRSLPPSPLRLDPPLLRGPSCGSHNEPPPVTNPRCKTSASAQLSQTSGFHNVLFGNVFPVTKEEPNSFYDVFEWNSRMWLFQQLFLKDLNLYLQESCTFLCNSKPTQT